MRSLIVHVGLIGGVILALATPTQAGMVTYRFNNVTNNNAANAQTGADQLFVQVSNGGSQVTFAFYNLGPNPCSITDIYYDDGVLLQLIGLVDYDDGIGGASGVDFSPLAAPGNLPGGENCSPNFETTKGFSADSDPPVSSWGVEPGEWLGMVYALRAGGTLADIQQELAQGTLRIGLHVQAFSEGGSESFVNDPIPIPVPEPLTLILLSLGVCGLRRSKIIK